MGNFIRVEIDLSLRNFKTLIMDNSTNKIFYPNTISLLALFIFIFSSFQLNAQITIEEDVFTKWIGKKYKEVLYETNLDIDGQLADIKAAIGPDQIYDFSDLNYIDSTISIFETMLIDPNDPFLINPELASSQYIYKVTLLPGAGGVQDTATTFLYTSLIDGLWTVNGGVSLVDFDMNGVLDTAVQFFLPPSLVVPFPVTSTSEWYDSTTIVNIFMGMEFTSSTSIDTTTVEGYGTLITPYGTAEALRLHEKSITYIPGSPIFDISNDLDFVTADDMFGASIVIEDGRAFYRVRTEIDGPVSTIDLDKIKFAIHNVAPNPFHDFFEVKINMIKGGEVECRLISMNGNRSPLLKKEYLPSGIQSIRISTDDIPSGMYFLEVRSGQFLQHLSINKM